MDGFEVDFGKLVNETYQFVEQTDAQKAPATPGVFYRIIEHAYAYQIQVLVSEGGAGTNCATPAEDEHFFPTDCVEQAQVIADSVAHRRFPKQEANFYNIGDPTENWWMVDGGEEIKILLRSYGLEESGKSQKSQAEQGRRNVLLGPLGDSKVAVTRFQRLKEDFALSGLEVSEKMIRMVVGGNGERNYLPFGGSFERVNPSGEFLGRVSKIFPLPFTT